MYAIRSYYEGNGQIGPAFRFPVVEGKDETAVILQHACTFDKNAGEHTSVLARAVAIGFQFDGRIIQRIMS